MPGLNGGPPEYVVWVVVELRRALVGWWVLAQYGPAVKRRWFLHYSLARLAFCTADANAWKFMRSAVAAAATVARSPLERA